MNTSFRDRVYKIAAQIPEGKVATYGQIAMLAGSPGAARAVGTAMRNNPDMKTVPCHRVVGSDGKMHGYAFGKGIESKKERLKKEGVSLRGGKVDLQIYRWCV
jgi:methylated-DNA-protein-cysteine methyltransferase-like protein